MPFREMPSFRSIPDKLLQIPQPGVGGLNLYDLEYEQEPTQTPYMLNMMYKNGSFSKRYGQSIYQEYEDKVYAVMYFNHEFIVHAGTKIYRDGEEIGSGIPEKEGIFIKFSQSLYYWVNGSIYEYKYDNHTWLWTVQEPYIPDVFINCEPQKDGTYDRLDDLNLLTLKFKSVYNGDGSSTNYYAYGDEDDIINWDIDPVVYVDEEKKVKGTDFSVSKTDKKITFTSAPAEGALNVEIVYTLKSNNLLDDRERLLGSRYYSAYGANGTMHLFLAGGGDSKLFYSETYDASYFPENNWVILGSTEDDITGFGLQYNTLLAFKPHEIYSLYSYQITASMVSAENEQDICTEAFSSIISNASIGCDCPHTIQLINNQLTWFNSIEGVCTLVSTNINDERNVRVISRNINHTNTMGLPGILDLNDEKEKIQSVDFDSKYFLCFPDSSYCYVWDYVISPFVFTSSKVTDPKTLSWFLFDKFHVKQFMQVGKDLCYVPSFEGLEKNVVKLNDGFTDLDFDGDSYDDAINSFYLCPLLEFSSVESLKTIKNVYIQCRADRPTKINFSYITEDSPNGEVEPEPIDIGGMLWDSFSWDSFDYDMINFMNVYRRKCSIKKTMLMGIKFWNEDLDCDMSISHLSFQYQIVKYVK